MVPATTVRDRSGKLSLGIWMDHQRLCIIADDTSIFPDLPMKVKRMGVFCYPLLAEVGDRSTISGLLLSSTSDKAWIYHRFGTFTLDRNCGQRRTGRRNVTPEFLWLVKTGLMCWVDFRERSPLTWRPLILNERLYSSGSPWFEALRLRCSNWSRPLPSSAIILVLWLRQKFCRFEWVHRFHDLDIAYTLAVGFTATAGPKFQRFCYTFACRLLLAASLIHNSLQSASPASIKLP